MKKIWDDAWGPRMEHILRNARLVLLDQEHATLPDILRLFHDDAFRKRVAAECTNPQVKAFWLTEYPKYSYRLRADGIMPIQNKVGAFLATPTLYRILAEPEKTLNFRWIMDEGKILVINLGKGKIGEGFHSSPRGALGHNLKPRCVQQGGGGGNQGAELLSLYAMSSSTSPR